MNNVPGDGYLCSVTSWGKGQIGVGTDAAYVSSCDSNANLTLHYRKKKGRNRVHK